MNENKSNFRPIFVSPEEEDVINDIRALEFGKILINIQNSTMVNREITKTIRNIRKKNNIQNDSSNNVSLDDYN
ncbi:MAG: hypothetical protein KAI71_06225 [Candidatus Pacebacteria bacterium]|nr:hypothetical protein [Candidatus Paceibacterota bacterium]